MMRVGIDTQIAAVSRAGIGHFTAMVARALPQVDTDATYIPFCPSPVKDFSMPQRWWWDQVTVPGLARHEHVDVLLKPAFSCPMRSSVPTVVIVQDLAARKFPRQVHRPSAWFYGRWLPWTLRFATRIIAISEYTADEITRELGVAREKISVVTQGVAMDDVVPNPQDAGLLGSLGLAQKKFILHVGTIEPRKNLAFLVRTFAKFHTKYPNYVLVLAGADGWLSKDVHDVVASRGLADNVVFTGSIAEDLKFALLRAARVLAFPSLYEGFGRPPLEAMACGTPVVAACTSSVPEVVGDAGILLTGYDEGEWVRSLETAAEDDGTRARLVPAGIARSKGFTWERAAQQIADILHSVAHE